MAPLFLILHAVFVLVTALLGQYLFSIVFALLGAYFFIAFHPSFFRIPSIVMADQSARIRTSTKHLVPRLVDILKQYSLSVTFACFYAGVFGITFSLGWFSYDVAAFAVSAMLFSLSWYFRHDSVPIIEEFFRTNTLLFSAWYVFVFAFRAFSGMWYTDPYFFANIALSVASYVFVVFGQPSIGEPPRRAFFAAMLLYSTAAASFFTVNILSYSGVIARLTASGVSAWVLVFAIALLAAAIFAFVLPRMRPFAPYVPVSSSVAEVLFLLSFAGLSINFLWSDRVFFSGLLLLGYCFATLGYFRIRQSQSMLAAAYIAISELFLSFALPSLTDPSGLVNLGIGAWFSGYVFPLFVIFLVPSLAIAVTYAFPLPRYYSFSLVLFAVAYSIPVFCYVVVRFHERFFQGLFLSVAGICFFALFLFVSIRVSAARRLDRKA